MLTSFFEKSKPVHFLILGAFIVFGFVWTLFLLHLDALNGNRLLVVVPLIIITVLSIILLDFIVGKNNLTRRNAYAIFLYSCFILMLPVVFQNSNILWANIFILLALRRILSLRNDSNSEIKIFEAAIWITVASLFYFWSILFFVPLWVAVIKKPRLTYKQMLIPVVGFFTVLLLNSAYQLLTHERFLSFFEEIPRVGFDFSAYNSIQILIPATLILALLIWSGFHRLQNPASIPLRERSSYWMIFIVAATTLAITICGPDKNGSEMIFLFAPTAILTANYIEGIQSNRYKEKDKLESWFKEILLWVVVLFAIVFLFL